ncbi:MAG: hypothetical protein WBN85_11050 [Candidatus Macondimonas sp.]
MKPTVRAGDPHESTVRSVRTCRQARKIALGGLLVCAFGQLLIDASARNLACVFIAVITSAITFHFVIRGSVFRAMPLPALVVLGFNVSTRSGALIAQTASLRSLVFNLQVPEITFALCALFQVSLLVALFTFLSSSTLRAASRTVTRRVWSRMSIMQAPTAGQLWIMGFIGSAAMAWISSKGYSGELRYGDVVSKFIDGIIYLAFAPFLLPILEKAFPSAHPSTRGKISSWPLIGYLALLFLIAMIRNSRGAFAMGVANLGMGALVLILIGQLHVTLKLRRRLAIGAVITLIAAPVLSDLATAMVVVRGQRTEVSSTELVQLTLSAFNDKQALEDYRQAVALLTGSGEYEENYLANPFIARFVQTKFFDNSLSYEDVRTGRHASHLWDVTLDKIMAYLPTPALTFLGIDINKEDLQFSMGDALYNSHSGTGLGGYRTGSPIGHGIGLMGSFIFIVAIPLFLLAFMALQSLTTSVGSLVLISPVILLKLMSVYGLAAGDSLLDPIGLMLRGLPQNILIYWMAFHGTRWIGIFSSRRPRSFGPHTHLRSSSQASGLSPVKSTRPNP